LAGRKINDDMGGYVAGEIVKKMIKAKQHIDGARVAIMGLAFKENVGDVRNTKIIDIIDELKEYGVDVIVHDPIADPQIVYNEFGIELAAENELTNLDCIVMAVPHDVFMEKYDLDAFSDWYKAEDKKVFVDI